MHKPCLFSAIYAYVEDLFSMKLTEEQKKSIRDAFDSADVEDGIERTIQAIEKGLHIRVPQELFVETRVACSEDSIESLLKEVNFEASMWYMEEHEGA
ncbi:hypothetical protein [Fusibacter tunisiensis]|uniref:Uncharacterized protein n=1 Tax=Fusibacter tunisiensis TaxID=1008308 RepID=A0ABS2MTC0_9FIRM|nr:hypothetical protein [Fusibacter tunisiensis]MBM7562651.1 hypothetical protein [Fusibacter tunisiensis]